MGIALVTKSPGWKVISYIRCSKRLGGSGAILTRSVSGTCPLPAPSNERPDRLEYTFTKVCKQPRYSVGTVAADAGLFGGRDPSPDNACMASCSQGCWLPKTLLQVEPPEELRELV